MNKRFSHKTLIISVIVILVIVLSVLPLTPALAASIPDDGNYPRLEKLLQRERTALEKQQTRLDRTDENITRTQNLIEKAKAKGLDTSSLEAALVTYQGRLPAVLQHHDKAASLLANPAGFDVNGKVIDRKEAIKTLRAAGDELLRAHLKITEATLDLRAAVMAFLEANKSVGITAKP